MILQIEGKTRYAITEDQAIKAAELIIIGEKCPAKNESLKKQLSTAEGEIETKEAHIDNLNEQLIGCETTQIEQDSLIVSYKASLEKQENKTKFHQAKTPFVVAISTLLGAYAYRQAQRFLLNI